MFSVFVRKKVIVFENVSFIDHASGMRLPDGCKLAIHWKKDNQVTICRHDVIVIIIIIIIIFLTFRAFLVKFNYWSKFHVNIMTGSGVMTIFHLYRIDEKSRNRKYPRLNFARYLETGAS